MRFEFTDSLLSVAALPYNIDDLDPEARKRQYHSGELVERNKILCVDMKQMGVGGIDSWDPMPVENTGITPGAYQYSYP